MIHEGGWQWHTIEVNDDDYLQQQYTNLEFLTTQDYTQPYIRLYTTTHTKSLMYMQGLSSNRGENNGNNCLKVFVLEAASGSMQYRHPMQVESPANKYNLQ